MNRVKIILSYILGFSLSILLLLLSMIFILKKSILDKNFIFRLFDENNYYENIYNSINEDIEDYMTSSGLENEILKGVVLKENVKNDINNYIDYMYEGKLYKVDTTYIHDTLSTNIDNYLKGLNLGVDNTNELDLFISDIESIYSKEVSFYNMFDSFVTRVASLTNIIDKYMGVACVIVLLLFVVVIIFNKINIGSIILSSGIMLYLLKLFIYERVDTQNILLVSDYFSSIIRSSFKYIGSYMINISVLLMVIGLLLCLFNFRRNNLEKRNSN